MSCRSFMYDTSGFKIERRTCFFAKTGLYNMLFYVIMLITITIIIFERRHLDEIRFPRWDEWQGYAPWLCKRSRIIRR